MKRFDYDKVVDNLPAGLDRAILRILSFHVGREKAISRSRLLTELIKQTNYCVDDRSVRAQINLLRKGGATICSTGGKDGGYYMASGWDELDEYISSEIHSRAMDLLEQEKALRTAGEYQWGRFSPHKQHKLF